MIRRISYWIFVRVPVWFVITSIFIVTLLKWVPVRYTPLMLKRAFQFREMENYHTEQEWVSLEYISPELIKAVLSAEDARFFKHHGFDWEEIYCELHSGVHGDSNVRGCSSISQQTAKNVFTLGSRTWARKTIEAWWTVLIEWIWGKNRILEVYMNVAELGSGVYGFEAASNHYFNTSSSCIKDIDAATLAACLPSPLIDQPGNLSLSARIRKRVIIDRMVSSK